MRLSVVSELKLFFFLGWLPWKNSEDPTFILGRDYLQLKLLLTYYIKIPLLTYYSNIFLSLDLYETTHRCDVTAKLEQTHIHGYFRLLRQSVKPKQQFQIMALLFSQSFPARTFLISPTIYNCHSIFMKSENLSSISGALATPLACWCFHCDWVIILRSGQTLSTSSHMRQSNRDFRRSCFLRHRTSKYMVYVSDKWISVLILVSFYFVRSWFLSCLAHTEIVSCRSEINV